MTLYTVVNPSSLAAGQPEDITQVLANFQAIQGILNGGIDNSNVNPAAALAVSKLALGASGQILQSVGPTVAWGMKITVSPITSPPGSPVDGDIWIATGMDSVGTRWQFQYNAASASPYKWEFIGGPPVTSAVGTAQSISASSAITDLGTVGPSISISRLGEYLLKWSLLCVPGAPLGGTPWGGAVIAQGGGARIGSAEAACPALNGAAVMATAQSKETLNPTPTAEVRVRYYNNNGNAASFQQRSLEIMPVRI